MSSSPSALDSQLLGFQVQTAMHNFYTILWDTIDKRILWLGGETYEIKNLGNNFTVP